MDLKKMNNHYDIIITGGGCAGLSLAYKISKQQKLNNLKVLIIEKEEKKKNDRTWCFWTTENLVFNEVISKSWGKLQFSSGYFDKTFDIKPFQYHKIEAKDFYPFVKGEISKNKNNHLLQDTVHSIDCENGIYQVKTGQKTYTSKLVFNSILDIKNLKSSLKKNQTLLNQHFKGWKIKTENICFDSNSFQMFDFDIPQNKEVRFVYILPESSTKALIEFTIFSKKPLIDNEYDHFLKKYISKKLNIDSYIVEEVEKGEIPMTDFKFRRIEKNGVHNIGIKGGMSKASSGYTFYNIQKDSSKIAESLCLNKILNPYQVERYTIPERFRIYDSMILDIMENKGEYISKVFSTLFQKNSIHKILKFLNNKTSFLEDLKIMSSVPSYPFIKAFLKKKLL